MDYPCRFENGLAPEVVAAGFHTPLADQIHIAFKDLFQFILHMDHFKEGQIGSWRTRYKHIHVAIRPEIGPQRRTKNGKLGNVPTFAKISTLFMGNSETLFIYGRLKPRKITWLVYSR